MRFIQMEPIVIEGRRLQTQAPLPNAGNSHQIKPPNVDALIRQIQSEFPNAHIRITGGRRTVKRQAELMLDRRWANRHQFLKTYVPAQHISEMDHWATLHPRASRQDGVAEFERIIESARQRGAVVSNHISDRARDISIPIGGPAVQQQVRSRLQQYGAHVINERDAVGGPHWHVDY